MYASRVASANPTQGAGLMLDAIAAVFLGMTMSEEGEPRVPHRGRRPDPRRPRQRPDPNERRQYVRDMLTGSIVIAAVAVSSYGKTRAR